jgi:hypothetical protein
MEVHTVVLAVFPGRGKAQDLETVSEVSMLKVLEEEKALKVMWLFVCFRRSAFFLWNECLLPYVHANLGATVARAPII